MIWRWKAVTLNNRVMARKTDEVLTGRVVDQLRDILAEGEYDTGQIAAAAKKAADMMRRGEVEVDWLAVHMEQREAVSRNTK